MKITFKDILKTKHLSQFNLDEIAKNEFKETYILLSKLLNYITETKSIIPTITITRFQDIMTIKDNSVTFEYENLDNNYNIPYLTKYITTCFEIKAISPLVFEYIYEEFRLYPNKAQNTSKNQTIDKYLWLTLLTQEIAKHIDDNSLNCILIPEEEKEEQQEKLEQKEEVIAWAKDMQQRSKFVNDLLKPTNQTKPKWNADLNS